MADYRFDGGNAPAYPQGPAAIPVPVPVQTVGAVAQPVPLRPIPVQPLPMQPAPAYPMPAQPMPVYPVPVQPAAVQPVPVQPVPTQPLPVQPVAIQPAAAQPAPAATPQPVEQGSAEQPRSPSGKAMPVLLTAEQKQKAAALQQPRRTPGRKAIGVREQMQERAEEGEAALWWRDFLEENRSWATSAAVHMLLMIALALYFLPPQVPKALSLLSTADEIEKFDDIEEVPLDGPDVIPLANDVVEREDTESLQPLIDMQNASEGIDAASQQLVRDSLDHIPYNDLMTELGTGTGKANQIGTGKGNRGTGHGMDGSGLGMGGRGGRRGKATGLGATPESESAVDSALRWLAEHQLPDGSWSFNHQLCQNCQGQCPNPGSLAECRMGATAMGVLPFLGAGHTNQVGKYQQTVGAALNYLVRNTVIDERGGRLYENNASGNSKMYSHGLAAIAVCEAFAMQMNPSDAKRLAAPVYDGSGEAIPMKKRQPEVPVPNLGIVAQQSLKFIATAQDPVGGGWRYEPRQPGDMSVVGWQMMALMSGRIAYLEVPGITLEGAKKFLNDAQRDDYGGDYRYIVGEDRGTNATQAIGLLCRMYLGWDREHQGIVQGVEALSRTGPRDGEMYYNYYATQVLHHYGGDQWEQWNPRMRDSLVASQSKAGHTAGSWYFGQNEHGGAEKGGRLYFTSLAALTLEVYYRHLPIYRNENFFDGQKPKAADDEKPADDEL